MSVYVLVDLQERASGDIQQVKDTSAYSCLSTARFCWEEGTYSCDCNRLLLFARAGGEVEPDLDALVCGDGAFVLLGLREEEELYDVEESP